MIKKIFKLLLLLSVIAASMLVYNEILYFTGWKDNASTPDNKAPVHFYVINLDRQPERFAQFKIQADRFGINVERISATDGYKAIFVDRDSKDVFTGADVKAKSKEFLAKHQYDVHCSNESYLNKEPAEFVYHAFEDLPRALTAGEIGIDCSSRLLWKRIANSQDDQIAVIFEDDAVLLENFDKNIVKFTSLLPTSWDIAYLDADVLHLKKHLPYSIRWLLPISDILANNYFIKIHNETNVERIHAYAINKNSSYKLLESHNQDNSVPIDYTIARAIQRRDITAYIAKNKIVSYNEALESEISTMGRDEFGN